MSAPLKRPAQAGNLGAAAGGRPGGASSTYPNPVDCLSQLAELADARSVIDPAPKRRARHRALAKYLAGRIARRVLRALGRAWLDLRGAELRA